METKFEDLLSGMRRLEDQEEQDQQHHQPWQPEQNVYISEVSTNDFSTNDYDDSLSDVGIIRNEEEEEELDEPHNQMEESKGDGEKFHDKQLLISLDEKQDVASNQEEDVPLARSLLEDDLHTDVLVRCLRRLGRKIAQTINQ